MDYRREKHSDKKKYKQEKKVFNGKGTKAEFLAVGEAYEFLF